MKPYTIKDLGELIKTGKESGLSSLSFADVKLEFFNESPLERIEQRGSMLESTSTINMDVLEKESLEAGHLDSADEELARLQVDDPALFEDMLIQREVEKRGEIGDEDQVL